MSAGAAEWSFPAPKGATVEWVTSSAQVNNLNIKARKFQSQQGMEAVLQFYRNLWEGNFAEIDYGPWRLISAKNDDLMYTVQVQVATGGNGSFGILGVSDIPKQILSDDFLKELAKNFPKMQGSQIESDMKMDDPGKNGQVILLTNKFSIASNISYYKNYYQNRDWQTRVDQSSGFSAPHTLVFAKDRQLVNLVISRSGGKTNVVANLVKKGVINW